MRRSVFSITLLICLLVSASACSEASNVKKGIIGKWIAVDKSDTVEFVSDGTVIVVAGGKSRAGNFKFLPDGRLKIDFGIGATVIEASIDKEGTLNLKEPSGKVSKYLTEKAYKAQLDAQRKMAEDKKKAEEEYMEKLRANFVFSELTVHDKTSGLMWVRNAFMPGKGMTVSDALNFIRQLNDQKYAGYSDWRLPEKTELATLAYFAKKNGFTPLNVFLNKLGFRNVRPDSYWTSTPGPGGNGKWWWIRMSDGAEYGHHMDYFFNSVWPVRAA